MIINGNDLIKIIAGDGLMGEPVGWWSTKFNRS